MGRQTSHLLCLITKAKAVTEQFRSWLVNFDLINLTSLIISSLAKIWHHGVKQHVSWHPSVLLFKSPWVERVTRQSYDYLHICLGKHPLWGGMGTPVT